MTTKMIRSKTTLMSIRPDPFYYPCPSETSGIENDLILVFCTVFCAIFSSVAVLPASLDGLRLPRSPAFARQTGQ